LAAYPHYDIYNITTPSRGHTLDSSVGWVLSTITSTQLINGGGIVFAATFNNISNISWRSVLLVEETGVPGKKHRPVTRHGQTLSHIVVSSTPRHERDSNSQR
jgi:hypothetical protein